MKVCYIMLLLLLYFSDDIELIDGSDNSKSKLSKSELKYYIVYK